MIAITSGSGLCDDWPKQVLFQHFEKQTPVIATVLILIGMKWSCFSQLEIREIEAGDGIAAYEPQD